MKVAALYNIHANLPALQAVLADVRRAEVECIVVGGDVFPGPMPRETIECLLGLDLPCYFIRGNGDREVLAHMRGEAVLVPEFYRESMRWVAEQLRPDYESLIAAWPATMRRAVEGLGEVLFCHATPRNDSEIFTRLTPEERILSAFQDVTAPVIVCGHTHMQFHRQVGSSTVVNAGSVGMPFGDPGAYWVQLGPEVRFRVTHYDLAAATESVRRSGYPMWEGFAKDNMLRPPSEAQMLEVFAKAELQS